MALNEIQKKRDRDLFRRLGIDDLSPEEFAALERRLIDDEELRKEFLRSADLDAVLPDELLFLERTAEVPAFAASRWLIAGGIAGASLFAAAAALVLWLFGLQLTFSSPPPSISTPMAIGSDPDKLRDIAVVTNAEDVVIDGGPAPKVGQRVRPGLVRFESGRLQLQFFNGAVLLLEGPTELLIQGPTSAVLTSGKAAGRFPAAARGFRLSVPRAAIVDFAGAFSTAIDPLTGNTEVTVSEGRAEISLIGPDGNTRFSQEIAANATVRIEPTAQNLVAIERSSVSMPRIMDPDRRVLTVTPEFAQMIREAKPLFYWRFEQVADGLIPNEMGERWPGRLLTAPDEPDAIGVADGVLSFHPSTKPRYIIADGLLPGFNRDAYSLELWVKPAALHWGTLVNVTTPSEIKGRQTLTCIELAHQTSMVHEPGAVRFLHRFPPGGAGGLNLFSEEICNPGGWHHIVAVKTPGKLALYVDGGPVSEWKGDAGHNVSAYRLLIGQLAGTLCDRQFIGMMDEVAVYDRALPEDEIRQHFYAIVPGQSKP